LRLGLSSGVLIGVFAAGVYPGCRPGQFGATAAFGQGVHLRGVARRIGAANGSRRSPRRSSALQQVRQQMTCLLGRRDRGVAKDVQWQRVLISVTKRMYGRLRCPALIRPSIAEIRCVLARIFMAAADGIRWCWPWSLFWLAYEARALTSHC
jgi:hypothetical protein